MNVLAEIVGDSAGIRRLREQIEHVLKRAATGPRLPPILLRGETGTGKGLVVRTVHRAGPRAATPFVDVNCAAIPDNLLEAELFGYERGAFTGAHQAKPGLFQLAHHGMLFLDEIGMLSPALQAKLLKVLEDGAVRRLGGTRPEPVDVWIVSATNEDLVEAMRARRFREDLYHRLAVLSLELPPLRERGSDVVLLAERFLARACTDYGLPPKTFAPDARAALGAYEWPGNVRELGNVVERVALLADEPVVTAAMLALPITTTADDPPGMEPPLARSSRDQMRTHLLEALTETGWNISRTALRLRVARNTVLARMARFGLKSAGPRREAVAARTDAPLPSVATSNASWEPRRMALLRVDVDASRALDDMIEKVQTFGGDIVELGPSAFMAAFGLQVIEDASARAALAALAVLKATERARRDGGTYRAKIVIHVAQVLVSQHHGSATIDLESKEAASQTIDALVDLNELDTILVSEATAPFLDRRFELTSAVIESGVAPFRRLTRRERTGFGLGGRPLSRFVGRDSELRLVTDRVTDVASGRGQVIGIVGEPGVGKSRFVYELTRIDAMHDWRVLRCGGVSHGSTMPFLAVGDLLRRYFAIEDADGPDSIREKVTGTIRSRYQEWGAVLTPLLSLLDIAVDDSEWAALDPPQQRRRIQDAVKRLVLDESRIQPLVLIVEDLHWIDTSTQALLDVLVESVPAARLLLLVNYRPEYQHRWGSKTYYSQLRLGALAPESARELVRALLGEDPALEALARLLVERGIPFFIEESVQTLVETGALHGERGAYRVMQAIQTIEIPATVQTILAARIGRLSAEDRSLLQTASVIGKDIPVVLLQAVAALTVDELHRSIARLQAAEFLYEIRFPPDGEYTFKHALTHEVTYGTLLPERRTDLHARIVGAIERAYPDRLTEHVDQLAHHAVRGERWDEAVTWSRRAAARAASRSAYAQAAAHLEEALAALGHLQVARSITEQAVDIRLELREILVPLGEPVRNLARLEEALPLAASLGDPRRMARVYLSLATGHWALGNAVRGLEYAERALAAAEEVGDLLLRTRSHFGTAVAHHVLGDYRRAIRACEATLALLDDEVAPRVRFGVYPVYAKTWLAFCLAEVGDFSRASDLAREADELARANGRPESLVTARAALGSVCHLRGDFAEAAEHFERGLALCREAAIGVWLPSMTGGLGHVYALLGRPAEAQPLLDECLVSTATKMRSAEPLRIAWLAEAHLLAGRTVEAQEVAMRALELARERKTRSAEALVWRLLGEVASTVDPPDIDGARGHYDRALALAEEIGMRPLIAHCHAGLARLCLRMGELDVAEAHGTTAAALYREMGMAHRLERAERPARPSLSEPSS